VGSAPLLTPLAPAPWLEAHGIDLIRAPLRHTVLVGDVFSEFSPAQRVGFVVSAALTQFSTGLGDLRRLLRLAAREDNNRKRPQDLDQLAVQIGGALTKSAERAIEQAFETVAETITKYQAESETTCEDEVQRHPPAPEQVIALLVMLTGTDRLQEIAETYMAACDGNAAAAQYGFTYLQWSQAMLPSTKAASCLVPMAVTEFETLLGALYRQWLTMYPDAVGNKTIPVVEARKYASIDDILRNAIDEKVIELVNRRPVDWARRVTEIINVEVISLVTDWGTILEVFARRNAIVHSGAQVDAKYLERTGRQDLGLGERLTCTEEYATSTLRQLEDLGTALSITILARLVPDGPEPALVAAPHILRCLKSEDWPQALRLAESVVEDRDHGCLPPEVLVNWWMARRESGEGLDGIRGEVESWNPPADDPSYRLARTALLFDEPGFRLILAGQDEKDGEQLRSAIKSWPLITAMRNRYPRLYPLFASKASASRPPNPPHRPRRKKRSR